MKKIIIINAPDDYRINNDKYIDFKEIDSNNFANPDLKTKNTTIMGITYTEGTTSPPKGILYKNLLVLSGQIFGELLKQTVDLEKYDRVVYCPISLFQAFSQLVIVFTVLAIDGTIVIAEKFNASTFWDDVRKYNAELISYYGDILQNLMDQPPKDIDRYHKARIALGGQATKELWNAFENRFNVTIFEAWAFTEAVGFTYNELGSK